jgi:hypothetical protein
LSPFILLPPFLSMVFDLSPLHFGVASFLIGCLSFEPASEACDNAPSLVALA